MDRENKTTSRHLQELDSLRQRVAELEALARQNRQTIEELGLFKSIVEASQEAIAISDPEGRLLYINPAHEKLFGRSLKEAKELNYRDYYPAESVEVLNRELAPALERGESWEGELEVFHASGRRFPLWARADSVRDADGSMLYGFGFMHDITPSKRLEQRLQEIIELNEKIFAASPLGICAFKISTGECVLTNDAAGHIVGATQEEVLDQNFYQIKSWQASGLLETAKKALASHREERQEIHITSTFGKEIWLDCRFNTFSLQGEPHLLLLFDDITERKRTEAALQQYRESLETRVEERTQELVRANAELQGEIDERRQAEAALKSERDFIAALLDTVGALVVVLDRDGRIVRFNQTCQTVTGYRADEVLGQPLWDFFLLPEEREAVMGVFHKLAAGQFPSTYENYWLTKDGEKILIAWSNTGLVGGDGQVEYIIGTGIDITASRQAEEALKEGEQRYSSLFENNHAVMLLIDPETAAIVDANPAACSFYGMDRAELTARKITDINTLPSGQVFQEMQRARSREHQVFHFRHRLATGDIRDVEVYSGPIEVRGRQLLYSIVHDITERRRAEAALKESEERFRILVDQSFDGIFVHEDFRIVDVNQRMADITGYSRSELLQMPAIDFFTKESVERIHAYIRSERTGYHELEIRKKDGQIIQVEAFGAPCTFHGRPARIVALRDIHERKQAEEALRQSENRFRELAENINEVFWIFDCRKQKVLYASPAFEQVWGRSVQALYNDYREWAGSIHPDDVQYAQESFQKILATGGGEPREYRIIRPDGSVRWVSDRGFAVLDEHGQVGRIVGIAEDITGRKQAEEALWASEAEKALVLSTISEVVIFHDSEMRLKWANRAAEESVGIPLEGLIGHYCYEVWQKREEPCDNCPVTRSLVSGVKEVGEMQGVGESLWLISGTPVKDHDGNIIGTVETALDITARKQVEEALRQSEERFRAIFDHVSVGMALVDANGYVLMANDADCRFLGYPREELVGLHFSAFTHPDDVAIDGELYESLLRGERQSYVIENRYVRKDGDIVWGRLSVSLIRDEQDQPQYTVIACEDITEQKQAEEALKRSQRQQKAILDNIPDMAWLKDRESRFIAVNEPVGQACGVRPEDLVGKTDLDIWPQELAEKYVADDQEVMRSGKRKRVEEPLVVRDHGTVWIETVKTPIYDEQGEVIGTTGIARDITVRKQAEEELRATKTRLEFLLSSTPAVIYSLKAEGDYRPTFVSGNITDQLGYQPDEVLREPEFWESLIHPDDAPPALAGFKQLQETGYNSWEYRVRHQDGLYRWILDEARLMRDAAGQPLEIIGFVLDITARKEAEAELRNYRGHLENLVEERTAALTQVNIKLLEEIAERERTGMALRDSEEKYRAIVETAQEGIWVIDLENKTSYVNRRLPEMLGYKPEEMLGAHLFDFMDEEARREAEENLKQTYVGVREVFEFRFTRKDGSDLWTITSTNPLFDANDKYVGALGMLTDISERRRAEMALKESEVRFRKIFEESPIGIGLRNLEGYFLETNPALERILGYRGEELCRLSFPQLIHPEDELKRALLYKELLEGRRDFYTAEFRLFHKDGSIRWNHVHVSLIHDANRCPLYSLAMLQDITREKQAEEELAAYQENLRSLASELSLTEERERRRLAEFLHDDIGQALALAKIKLGGLQQELAASPLVHQAEEVRDFLEQAIHSTRNLTFELSLPVLYEMGLQEAVEWLAEQFQSQYGLKIEVKRDKAPKPLAEGARVLLFRLVRELLTNVVKHAQARHAWIAFRKENGRLLIQLKDDGVGFEVNRKLSPVTGLSGGFGLFSVQERLSHLGGLMRVDSAPGQGTQVTISVPLTEAEEFQPVW